MVLPVTYLGSADYYRTLLMADDYQWEAWESFPKQTLRNRCVIVESRKSKVEGQKSKVESQKSKVESRKPILLSIPVKKVEHKQYTRDVEISYQQKWQHQHWMALVSAYGKTPFWMYYEEFFRPFYQREWKYLIDYDWAIHETILSLLHGQWPGKPGDQVREESMHRWTEDWQNQDLEQYWGGGLSIIDMLCEKGNETMLLLTSEADRK